MKDEVDMKFGFLKVVLGLSYIFCSVGGWASDTRPDSWIPFEMLLPEFNASFSGYIANGAVRLNEFSPTMSVHSQVWARDYIPEATAQFESDCDDFQVLPIGDRYAKNSSFELVASLYPFSENSQRSQLISLI